MGKNSQLPENAYDVDALRPRFADLARLGSGAQGGTYVAQDTQTGRKVVLKPMTRASREAAEAVRVLRSIASPHLPDIVDAISTPKATWLATAYVEGSCLEPGPVDLSVALADALAVAHALCAIHGAGTHHADVSAGNVVKTRTGGLVLVDLGQLGGRGVSTPGFIAPEVLAGGGGPQADWFSLGCLLCLRLFGEVPWRRPDVVARLSAQAVERRLEDLCSLFAPDQVPPAVRGLLRRLLDPDPALRPGSGPGILSCLRELEASARAGSDRVPPRWWLPRRFPYLGDLQVARAALADPQTRAVLIHGPKGSGRGRAVSELVGDLRGRCEGARVVEDADDLRDIADATGEDRAVAVCSWSDEAEDRQELRAARIRSVLRRSDTVFVLAATAGLARHLSDEPGVLAVPAPRIDADGVLQILQQVFDGDASAFAEPLWQASEGFPARVVAGICAAAGAQVASPLDLDLVKACRGAAPPALALEDAVAALREVWDAGAASVSATRVLAADAAREALGAPACAELARSFLASGKVSVSAAMDAQDQQALAVAVAANPPGTLAKDPSFPRVLQAALNKNPEFSTAIRSSLADALLTQGEAERALALTQDDEDPDAVLQSARALCRLGRSAQALEHLAAHGGCSEADAHVGLRFRALLDVGQADLAISEARARGELGPLAGLWAAYAALTTGDEATGRAWIEQASRAAEERDAPPGVAARIHQVRGSLAHRAGELFVARDHYVRALAAFQQAGERVGEAGIHGSLANLAVLTADNWAGVRHGRLALRMFMTQGETQRLPETALALVQLLGRVDELDEAVATGRACLRALQHSAGKKPPGAVALARASAVAAELASLQATGRPEALQSAGDRFVAAATALTGAGSVPEAGEARLKAASAYRRAQMEEAASAQLRWIAQHIPAEDPTALAAAVEAVRLACHAGDDLQVSAALSALHPEQIEAAATRGYTVLRIAHDTALLAVAALKNLASSPAVQARARRLREVLERTMDKQKTLSPQAVAADADDPTSLHKLLAEIDGAGEQGSRPATRPEPAPGPSPQGGGGQLLRMYRRLAREDDLSRLLEQVVDAMMDLTNAERGAVVLRGEGEAAGLEVTRELAAGTDGFRFSRSVTSRVMKEGQAVISVDAAQDDRFDHSRSISHLNLRSVLAVPLTFRGQVLGAAYVDHRLRRGAFDEADLAKVEEFADLAALAVAHATALSAVRSQAQELSSQREALAASLEARDVEVISLREDLRKNAAGPGRGEYRGIIGATEAMERVFRLIDRLADTSAPVVVSGESGTGKELVARAIHEAGPRAGAAFVAENCGAIPETLLESVLFGHAKGAFTGAERARPGLFEAAHGGTIFLDEVSEMPLSMQTKLLRVLQEREVRRVGENLPRPIDVRVIAASNRDLSALVDSGEFRQDLFYRINVVSIELPPLRDRPADIPPLVEHFMDSFGGGKARKVASSVLRVLAGYGWPGNVRELENEVRRWIALAGDVVTLADVSPAISGAGKDSLDPDDLRLRPRMARLERQLIARALDQTGGNQTQAAKLLGLSRYGLQKKLRRLEEDDA